MARAALERGQPYAMAFVDMRMPPGWDGLKTIEELWKVDPDVQVVICSAHTDYDWSEVVERLQSLRQAAGAAQARRADRGPAVRDRADAQVAQRAPGARSDASTSSR